MTEETNLNRFLRTWRDIPPAPRRGRPKGWQDAKLLERNAAMMAMYREGKTVREIAAYYPEISFQRVHQILQRDGAVMRPGKKGARPWQDQDVAKLKRLWDEGKSASQISAEFENAFSRNAVLGKVHRMGLPPRVINVTQPAPRPATSVEISLADRVCRILANAALAIRREIENAR